MKHNHDGITVGSITLPYSINRSGMDRPKRRRYQKPIKGSAAG